MGKYSNVQAKSLQNALNQAIKEIKQHNLSNIKNNLNRKTIFQTEVSKKVINTINSITNKGTNNGNLSNLKNKLETLKNISGCIIKCQELEKDIESLRRSLINASKYSENRIRNQISSKERLLRTYESQVDGLLARG